MPKRPDNVVRLFPCEPEQPYRRTSGFFAVAAKRKLVPCSCCGETRKPYLRPDGELWCGECIVDDVIGASTRPATPGDVT